MKQSAAGSGSTAKHAGTTKTSSTAAGKHAPSKPPVQTIRVVGSGHVTVTLKMPKPPKPRGLALGDAFPVCAAEAVAASLRLAGGSVSDSAVLALHRAAGGSETVAVSIGAALAAASEAGLAGARPLWFGPVAGYRDRVPVILGLDGQAQPHAVCAEPGGNAWWTWGERREAFCWPEAFIEEAWAVAW